MTITDLLAASFLNAVRLVMRSAYRPHSRACWRTRLAVELLEDRVVPADYHWNPVEIMQGVFATSFSDGRNWADGNGTQYPQQNDGPGQDAKLFFDGGTPRKNANCEVDGNSDAFVNITMRFAYSGEIILTKDIRFEGTLGNEVNVRSDIDGGRIRSLQPQLNQAKKITFDGSPLLLTSSRMFSNFYLINAISNTLTIHTGPDTWSDFRLRNLGTINWDSDNTINVDRLLAIENDGQFNISGAGRITPIGLRAEDPQFASSLDFLNSGTVTKTGDNKTTNIKCGFGNSGSLLINGGTLLLTSKANAQFRGRTELNGGALTLRSPIEPTGVGTFYVSGGKLGGIGTISGSVAMNEAPNQAPVAVQVGRGIHPGVGSGPGTLTITGNLTMPETAELYIDTNAAGAVGRLQVNGLVRMPDPVTIVVQRPNGFEPAVGAKFVFASWSGSEPNPIARPIVLLVNNSWGAGLSFRSLYAWGQGPGELSLFVVRAQAGAANANAGNPVLLAAFQNDPDFNGALTISKVNGNANNVGVAITTTNGGSFMALEDGSCDYVPPDSTYGEDSVEVTITDGTIEKVLTVTFDNPDPTPTVNDAEFALAHDSSLEIELSDYSVGLLDNAVYFDPETMYISQVNDDPDLVGEAFTTGAGGSMTIYADGHFIYEAPEDYVGDDTISFRVTDDDENTATANMTLHVVNTYAGEPLYATLKNGTLTVDAEGGLLLYTGDVDGDPLTVTKVAGSAENVGEAVATAEGGTVTIEESGALVYEPAADFSGDDSIEVTISDGNSETTFTATFHVVQVIAHEAGYSTLHDAGLTVAANEGLLTFAGEADNESLTLSAVNDMEDAVDSEVETGMGGTIIVEADGSYDYTPPEHYAGFDSVTFTVSNGSDTFTATLWISVTDELPVADSVADSISEDGASHLDLYANVSDDDSDTLTVTIVQEPEHGSVVFNSGTNEFDYTPDANFNGEDYFLWTANDRVYDAFWAAAYITVDAVNDAPLNTVPAAQVTGKDTNLVFSTGNGNLISIGDVDAGSSSVQVALTATHGTLTLSGTSGLSFSFSDGNGTGAGDGTADATMTFRGTISNINTALAGLTFIPTSSYTGSASVQIVSNDLGNTGSGGALTDDDTVSITVASPWVGGLSVGSGVTSGNYAITLTGIGFTYASSVSFGSTSTSALTVNSDTSLTVTVPSHVLGAVHVTVTTMNGTSPTSAADVFTYINGAPTGGNNTVYAEENAYYIFQASDFGFNDWLDNPINNFLSVRITTLPTVGTLTLDGNAVSLNQYISVSDIASGKLRFTPAANTYGSPYDSFGFKVRDDGGIENGGSDLDGTERIMTIVVNMGL